jgi:hypothetical protein
MLYIFGKLINRRNDLGGTLLVPIFCRVSKNHFSPDKLKNGNFLGKKPAILDPKKGWGKKFTPPDLFFC